MNSSSEDVLESDLTDEQALQLRQLLVNTRDRLLRSARSGLELSMNRETDVGRDSIDESTEEELLSTALRLHDREKKLLGKIQNALARLEEGTINECDECTGPIGFKRLMVRPVTTLCIACKEMREAQEEALEMNNRATSSTFSRVLDEGGPEEEPV